MDDLFLLWNDGEEEWDIGLEDEYEKKSIV
jgi:hypothetical protein